MKERDFCPCSDLSIKVEGLEVKVIITRVFRKKEQGEVSAQGTAQEVNVDSLSLWLLNSPSANFQSF